MISTRPARDSALWRESSGEALTEDQKFRGLCGAIAQDAQNGEKGGAALGFVDDDQTAQRLERGHGILHQTGHGWVF